METATSGSQDICPEPRTTPGTQTHVQVAPKPSP